MVALPAATCTPRISLEGSGRARPGPGRIRMPSGSRVEGYEVAFEYQVSKYSSTYQEKPLPLETLIPTRPDCHLDLSPPNMTLAIILAAGRVHQAP